MGPHHSGERTSGASAQTAPVPSVGVAFTPTTDLQGLVVPVGREQDLPVEAPHRTTPTASWSYRWLGIGIYAGGFGALAIAGGASALAGGWLLQSAPLLLAAGTGLVAASRATQPARALGGTHPSSNGALPTDKATARVAAAVNALVATSGTPAPGVVRDTELCTVRAVDGSGAPQAILFNPAFVDTLTNPELTAVVAHALSQFDRTSNLVRVGIAGIRRFTETVTLIGAFSHYVGVGAGLIPSAGIAVALTWLGSQAIRAVGSLAARASEMRTDIRAVELTGDLGSALSALTKTPPLGAAPARGLAALRLLFAPHPSVETRTRWLRAACGNPTPEPTPTSCHDHARAEHP